MNKKIDPTMSMKQIQAILDEGGDIVFAKGKYNITSTLYITSNSTIICEKGVIFVKKCFPSLIMTKVNGKTTKYKGAHDISWIGGTIISEVKGKNQSNLITIVHAKNILIRDVVVERSCSQHCIEVNSSKNVAIFTCVFKNHTPPKPHKEVIQIDFASYSGLTYANANDATYDGTHCEGVYIKGCGFVNCNHAIGTHTCSHENKSHKDIEIIGNDYTSDGKEGIFVKCLNMQGVIVENNYIENVDTMIKLNTIKTETLSHGGTIKVDKGKPNKDVVVRNNTLSDYNEIMTLI